MSDFEGYDDDEDDLSLDDVAEKELEADDSVSSNWDDSYDDMDPGDWGNQYGNSDEELEDEDDPWGLN